MAKKVLFVEDEAATAFYKASILKEHSFEVETALKGEHAVELAESDPDISLVLMDIDLGPGLDGSETAKRILEKREVPIVFLTGHNEAEYVKRTQKIANYGYVLKSAGESVLIDSINRAYELFETYARLRKENERRRQTAAALRTAEHRYHSLFTSIRDAILVADTQRNIVDCNPAFSELFGYTLAELYGKKTSVIYGSEDEYEWMGKELREPGGNAADCMRTLSFRKKGGSLFPGEINSFYSKDERGNLTGYIYLMRDISKRVRAEREAEIRREKLETTKEFLSNTLDGLSSTIAILDEEGTILKVNASWREFAERNAAIADAVSEGVNYLEVCDRAEGMSSEEAGQVAAGIREVLSGKREMFALEYPCDSPDKKRWFIVRVSPFRVEGAHHAVVAHEDITERKKMEEELRKSEEKYRKLFKSALVGILLHDKTGKIAAVNQKAEELFGMSAEELTEKTLDYWGGRLLTSSGEPMKETDFPFSVAAETKRSSENRVIGMAGSGEESPKWFLCSACPITSKLGTVEGVLVSFVDITSRVRAQEELRVFRNQLFTILENLDSGVFVVSPKTGKILYVNTYLWQVFSTDMIGHTCTEVFGYRSDLCEKCPVRSPNSKLVGESEPVRSYEYKIPNTEKWFFVQQRPIRWVDDSPVILHVLTDISPLKEAEQLREDVERITRHDLKSPLNSIYGSAQLIEMNKALSPEHREYVDIIKQSVHRMTNLIDQSLSLYKMEKGSYEVQSSEVVIEDVLQRVVREFDPQLRDSGIELVRESNGFSASSPIIASVYGEDLLCYSLFANLVKNAVEASENGDTVRITVTRKNSEWISVSIWNRTPLPREIQEHFGAKYLTHGKKRGTGLGLYSARLMTETQGGTLTWSSLEEEGTTITVTLPAVPRDS
jgi:PAS domain S-box-containing protein